MGETISAKLDNIAGNIVECKKDMRSFVK
jgi:hypothetical protein